MVGRGPRTAEWLFCWSGCFLRLVFLSGVLSFMFCFFYDFEEAEGGRYENDHSLPIWGSVEYEGI